MLFRIAFFALLFISLCSSTDVTSPNMRAFCMELLNITIEDNASIEENITKQTNETQEFSYSNRHDEALLELEAANASVQRMIDSQFPYYRARDIYLIAEQWFEGQKAIEQSGELGNYKFVSEKTSEVIEIEKAAFSVNDDINALSERLKLTEEDVNITEAASLQKQAQKEFIDNRFEEAQRLVDLAYDKITEAEAEATRSRALLESTRRTLEGFLQENWQNILVIVSSAAILAFIFQKQIRKFIVHAKIHALTAEKAVLETMTKNLQKQYFESGKMNEMTYHIKTKKFGELIRNINRQLPLLKEELKKI